MARCPQLADTAAKAHADPRTANADSPIENDMSDFLLASQNREPLQESFSDDANPLSLDGVEFIEYVTAAPQALGHVLEMMGFRPVARHRSPTIRRSSVPSRCGCAMRATLITA